jgi:ABC-type multidrug transport system ATPase subunit
LDEPTNSLDPESIDALAKAINEFEGGMVLVSHDMRLISQVAKEIWICDNKTITPYKGDIQSFKLAMRTQMGLEDGNKPAPKALRGDASVKINSGEASTTKSAPKKLDVVNEKKVTGSATTPVAQPPKTVKATSTSPATKLEEDDTTTMTVTTTSSSVPSVTSANTPKGATSPDAATPSSIDTTIKATSSEPSSAASTAVPAKGRYIPPHLRKKMMAEQQQ